MGRSSMITVTDPTRPTDAKPSLMPLFREEHRPQTPTPKIAATSLSYSQ
jgi:hypothetical protein